ncbi:MAG: S8 family serine peptidase [Bdellovibrionaceae bacterium]|nr:S8 family serine peptidase [Pseudobdellovibrionaceae bacterium]
MASRILRRQKITLFASTITLALVCLFEACSPMDSNYASSGLDTFNICDSKYDPPAQLTSKAVQKIDFVFSKQKVHLDSSLTSKATGSLLNAKIVVDIDLNCKSAPNSLSEKVLSQNVNEHVAFNRHAFNYNVEDDVNVASFTAIAENDPCVVGVTRPAILKATALVLPSSNDLSINNQLQLSNSNYSHAYEYIVKKFDGTTKAKVGFVDTGADCDHEDLKDNLISTCGFDAVNGTSANDNDGHGSHTLGIVGASTNNGKGILGLAGNTAEMRAIKVIDMGSGSEADAAEGIQYAIQQNLHVINVSLEAGVELPLIKQRLEEAVAAGIVVTIAAGNSGGEISSGFVVSPANVGKDLDGAITVGSINADSKDLSYFSNYGSFVEIGATGSMVDSKITNTAGIYSASKNGTYERMMGTSQAAPVVAGAAALLIQFLRQNGKAYTPAQIEQIIKNSTDVHTGLDISGSRVLNFSKLTRSAYQFAGVEICPAPAQ